MYHLVFVCASHTYSLLFFCEIETQKTELTGKKRKDGKGEEGEEGVVEDGGLSETNMRRLRLQLSTRVNLVDLFFFSSDHTRGTATS